MVLDLSYIFGIPCGTLCNMYKNSLIVCSEPESYLNFASSYIIVSQVVDSNIVFNHNSSYLVHL